MLAFANAENAPLIVVNRTDLDPNDFSATDSAAGLIKRNGSWTITE